MVVTDPPTADVYKLVLGKREVVKGENTLLPKYFFLIPEEFVERTRVVSECFGRGWISTGIKPIRVDKKEELLEQLDGVFHKFYYIDQLEEELAMTPTRRPHFGLFPVVQADIFERSGLQLPLIYQTFGKKFEMEILYTLTSRLFLSWLDEIRTFFENPPETETAPNLPHNIRKFTAQQKTLTHCELLAKIVVDLYETAEFTLWRDKPPEEKNTGYKYRDMRKTRTEVNERELYPNSKEVAIKHRFRRVETSPTMAVQLLQGKNIKKAWMNLKLKEECEDFFSKWIAYCKEPQQCLFISIPVFAIEHPWFFLDAIEKEVRKQLHDNEGDVSGDYYIPMMVHPTIIQLFDEAQDLQAFKDSILMQNLMYNTNELKTSLDKLLTRLTYDERVHLRSETYFYFHYPMDIFDKWDPQFDIQYYRHYFHQSFTSSSGKEEWHYIECNGSFTDSQLDKIAILGDINGKMYYFMTRVGPYLSSGEPFQIINDPEQTADIDLQKGWTTRCNLVISWMKYPHSDTREGVNLDQNHDYLGLLLFEQVLDYLELYQITTFINCLEKMVKRSEEIGSNSPEQVNLNRRVLERIRKSVATRKREEMECTAIFLEGFANYKECRHRTAAVFYAFFYFIRKQLILEKSHVNIRSYIETLSQYLDRHSKIAQILSYYSFEENTFVIRLQRFLNQLPLELQEQTNDIFRLPLPEYFTKWMAKKSFVGHFKLSQLRMTNQDVDKGGQAQVHLCTTDKFFCPVVFKSFINSSAHREVYSELGSLILLQAHPHIVRLFGFVVDKGLRAGILMEYCTGGSLDKLIDKEDYQFEEDMTAHWMGQAASGLKFLHANNIIHSDLKSSNMLLSSDRRLLKISDMGYCQDISLSADKKANYTSLKGTQGYIAPEIENGESYTTAADMFSFGRTLWSLIFKDLTPDGLKFATTVHCPLKIKGSPMFSQEQFNKLTSYIKNKDTIWEEYNRIKEGLPLVPEKMISLLTRLTTADPDLRPTSDEIYQEFTDYYEELLKTMDADRKAKLEFYPETKK